MAYSYKGIGWVFPNLSLYHVALYMPVFCFCIGLAAVCLFLYYTRGGLFAGGVGILMATLPGSIERSAAGFGDRDAWCLMIGILAVITYLTALQAENGRKRLFWTLASGGCVFLGGLSWEGFGVFLSVILIAELWRFLSTETEDGFGFYALWVCCFVPTLYLATPAYRNGYGFAEHLAAFVLIPPLVLLALRALRCWLLSRWGRCRAHARTLSLGMTLAAVAIGCGYVWGEQNTFADTTVPLSQNAVMAAMSELANPSFGYWTFRYGAVFLLGSGGLIAAIGHRDGHLCLLIPLALFIATTFFRLPLENVLGDPAWGTFLFSIALISTGIALVLTPWLQGSDEKRSPLTTVAFLAWFLLWVALSRDAKRYDIFIGLPLAFFTTFLLIGVSKAIAARVVLERRTRNALSIGITTVLVAGVLFLPPLGGHARRALYAATQMRQKTPPENVTNALLAMRASRVETAVVAAHWAYGSQLNVIAGVKTIIDQDTYLQNWILLYTEHVHKATDEQAVLGFLKTHGATHLMLTPKDPRNSFLRGELSRAFRRIYPEKGDTGVTVWALRYPDAIRTDVKYLKTGFPEIDDTLERP